MAALPVTAGDILRGWVIAVIDDAPDSLVFTKHHLEAVGATVITADNGAAGYELIRREQPRFAVCDLSLPEMSGWELVDAMRNDPLTAGIPIVVLTAHTTSADRGEAFARGHHHFIAKPLRPETFVNELLRLLINDFPELLLLVK